MQFSALTRLINCAQCLKLFFPFNRDLPYRDYKLLNMQFSAQTGSFHCAKFAFVSLITTHRDLSQSCILAFICSHIGVGVLKGELVNCQIEHTIAQLLKKCRRYDTTAIYEESNCSVPAVIMVQVQPLYYCHLERTLIGAMKRWL